jgi:TRAP-type C4-dicarboxylate transport system permease small subunit
MTKLFLNTLKKIFAFVSIALILFSLSFNVTSSAAGETTTPNTQDKAANNCEGVSNDLCYLQPSNIDCLFQKPKGEKQCKYPLFEQVLNFLQQLAPYVATLIIVAGGYEYFSDKNFKETSSTATIQAGVFGLIIVLLAPAITSVVTGSFTTKGIDPAALNILLTQLVDFLINISTFVAVVVIVIGGYTYFTEGFSSEGKTTKARNLVAGGVLGLIVMLFARPIASLIRDTLKITYRATTEKSLYLPGNNSGFESRIQYVDAPFVSVIKSVLSDFLIPLSSVATVLFIVFGGWYILTSSGDQKKYETGLNFLRNAVIGFIVVLLATTIVQLLFFFVKPTEFISGGTNCALVQNSNNPECKTNAAGGQITTGGNTNPSGATIYTPNNPSPNNP